MRVLIVEDNSDSGGTLQMVLQALGHEARHVHDGESALDLAPTFRPQVVIMDLGLSRSEEALSDQAWRLLVSEATSLCAAWV